MEEDIRRSEELTEEDALLVERIAAAAEEAPPTLRTGVWLRIAQERKRRRMNRLLRIAGVAACLLIVVPVALRLAPQLAKSVPTADEAVEITSAAAEAETVPAAFGGDTGDNGNEKKSAGSGEEGGAETTGTMNAYNGKNASGGAQSSDAGSSNSNQQTTPPASTTAPASTTTVPAAFGAAGPETTRPPETTTAPLRGLTASAPTEATTAAGETKAAMATVAGVPSGEGVPETFDTDKTGGQNGQNDQNETTAQPKMAMKSAKASSPLTGGEEDANARAARVLRTMDTEVKYDAWLAEKPTGSPYAYIRQFGIARETFLSAAEALGVNFTEEELDALFGPAEVPAAKE